MWKQNSTPHITAHPGRKPPGQDTQFPSSQTKGANLLGLLRAALWGPLDIWIPQRYLQLQLLPTYLQCCLRPRRCALENIGASNRDSADGMNISIHGVHIVKYYIKEYILLLRRQGLNIFSYIWIYTYTYIYNIKIMNIYIWIYWIWILILKSYSEIYYGNLLRRTNY